MDVRQKGLIANYNRGDYVLSGHHSTGETPGAEGIPPYGEGTTLGKHPLGGVQHPTPSLGDYTLLGLRSNVPLSS